MVEAYGILVFILLLIGSACIGFIAIRSREKTGSTNFFKELDRIDKGLLTAAIVILTVALILAAKFLR